MFFTGQVQLHLVLCCQVCSLACLVCNDISNDRGLLVTPFVKTLGKQQGMVLFSWLTNMLRLFNWEELT